MRSLFLALLLLVPSWLFGATTTSPITLTSPESCYSFFAGPNTGTYPTSLGTPSFRRLATADFTGASVVIPMPNGGTGIATTTAYGPICGGTTSTGAFQNAGAGTSGQFLKSNGASALPSWLTVSFVTQSATPFNTFFGSTGATTSGAGSNSLFGYHAGDALSSGSTNVAVGESALSLATSSGGNVAVGHEALKVLVTDGNNVALGDSTLRAQTSGLANTAIGAGAGTNVTTGQRNIFLGAHSGESQTTDSDAFYVDNQARGGAAFDKAGALLYGTFNATPGNQTLTVNGKLTVVNSADLTTVNNGASAITATAGGQVIWDIKDVSNNSVETFKNSGGTTKMTLGSSGIIGLYGSTSGSVALLAPAVAGSTTFQLPGNNGTNTYVLTTNGSGVTSWTAPAGGAPTGTAGGDLAGTYPNPTLNKISTKLYVTNLAATSYIGSNEVEAGNDDIDFHSQVGLHFYTNNGRNAIFHTDGEVEILNHNFFANGSTNGLTMGPNYFTKDCGVVRVSSGVVEINNGTPGTVASLNVSTINIGGNTITGSKAGTVTLVSGIGSISDVTIPDNAVFYFTVQNGSASSPGAVWAQSIGTSVFTISSTNGSDASTYQWRAFW